MKQLILARIEELSKFHNGFTKSTMRWREYYINNTHISVFNFSILTDYELLKEFERIIKRHYTQM
jgi:hypothetical protein